MSLTVSVDEEVAQCKALADILHKRYASNPPLAPFAHNADNHFYGDEERGDGRDIDSFGFRMTAVYSRESLVAVDAVDHLQMLQPKPGNHLQMLQAKNSRGSALLHGMQAAYTASWHVYSWLLFVYIINKSNKI